MRLVFLFSLLLVPTLALYIPCGPGTGLADPNKDQPEEKSCIPCKVDGCAMCTWDASRCTLCPAYNGPAGSVTDDGASKCKKCKSSKCGVCDDGYKRKCTGKVRRCPSKIGQTRSAKKTTVEAILQSESPKCWDNTQYWSGNGYTSLKVYQVDQKGRCIECQSKDWWKAGANYCWFYQQSLRVLANAFQEKTGCPYPNSISAKLENQCLSDNRGMTYTVAQKFSAKYCGDKKTVYVIAEANRLFSESPSGEVEVQDPYDDIRNEGVLSWSWSAA